MAIGGNPVRCQPGDCPRRLKERLGRCEVAGIAEPCINQVAVSVNRTVQLAPASLDFDIGFIDIPAVPDDAMTLLAQRLTQERR